MSEHSFDVVILGGGSGGYAAALRAAELGASVAIVEKDRVGGTCLHRGCVPTKALLHVAEVADTVRSASQTGVTAHLEDIDAAVVRSFREGIVAKKYKGLQGLLSARGITTVAGEGFLESDRSVRVGDDVYRGRDVVLATGARSRTLPGIERGGRILASEDALELPEIPRSVIVLGGGVIGVEFASLWRSLGADVTIVEALPRLVAGEDEAMSKGLERAFRHRGIRMSVGSAVTECSASSDAVTVTLATGESLSADYLLVSVGRAPATDGLGFEQAGVELEDGFVRVDDTLRTSAPHVWAVGDIVRGLQLAHRGFAQGIAVAERIAGHHPPVVPDSTVPRITYSEPEIASVGLSAAQAAETYGADAVQTYDYNLAGNARSEILGTSGSVRVVRRVDGPVVGVHMIGSRAGELIAEAQLVVGWEAHPEDIAPFLHPHPTQSEALGEAFLALAGRPLHAL
ncbi:dihydrolipoyl dehydrogenase [Microbacterium sp. NPDC078428]|uniref:dihydrolipoyl dehydrogenase n=1 Tax=Microbacterium sp. NPDC078428 TaxID=3364190 RepID=UPI0037C6A663